MAERVDEAIDVSTGKSLVMVTDDESDDFKAGPEKTNAALREVYSMINGDDDVTIGRLAQGFDLSEFDALPRNESEQNPDAYPDLYSDTYSLDETDLVGDVEIEDEDDTAAPFEAPAENDEFPMFRAALRHFQAAEPQKRVVRIDTPETHQDFICEQSVKELDRRVRELRALIEEHLADANAHGVNPKAHVLRQWDVLGAARAVTDLRGAKTTREAMGAMTSVPIELPDFAQGKVHCWRDGDCVICSMHFVDAEGNPRIATAGAKPSIKEDEVAAAAIKRGLDPTTVLGMLPEVASVTVGKRLVRDIAGAALKASTRRDITIMGAEPVLLTNGATTPTSAAPTAALMYLQQAADSGHPQAKREMKKIQRAVSTPAGKSAAPILEEVKSRLAAGRAQKAAAKKPGLLQRISSSYARAAGWGV